MNNQALRNEADDLTLGSTIRRIIGNSLIIDFGIIKEILGKGVVLVEMAAASGEDDIMVIACTLAGTASTNLAVNIEPTVGDKVMIFFPRRYASEMFDLDKDEVIIDEDIRGYHAFSGIAVLLNQCKEAYKNVFKVNNEGMNLSFGYDKDQDKFNITFSADSKGTIKLSNPKASVDITSEGDITVKNEKVTTELKNSGSITVKNDKAEITINETGTCTINAKSSKIAIKNTAKSLGKILDTLFTQLIGLKTAESKPMAPDFITAMGTGKADLGALLDIT